MNLKRCPCGEKPEKIYITDAGQCGKYFWASPSCCAEWSIEFRSYNKPFGSKECIALAVEAWNAAPRGGTINDIKCPECGSEEIQITLVDPPGLPETQMGDCLECMHHWNQDAR